MIDIEKSNYLTDLAARIRVEHESARHMMKSAIEHAMATGDMMLEAKEQLGHGQFMPWVRDHCGISQRTANLYMRLAKNRAKIEANGDTTINEAIRTLAPAKSEEDVLDDYIEFIEKNDAEISQAFVFFLANETIKRKGENRTVYILALEATLQKIFRDLGEEKFFEWTEEKLSDDCDIESGEVIELFDGKMKLCVGERKDSP